MNDERGVDSLEDLRRVNGIAEVMLNELNLIRESLGRGGTDVPERSYDLIASVICELLQNVIAESAAPACKQDLGPFMIVSIQSDARSFDRSDRSLLLLQQIV